MTNQEVWAGIDVGTTGAKLVLVDRDGKAVASGVRRYRNTLGTRDEAAGVEQDAEDWWTAVVELLHELVLGHRVRAVAVTSQAPSFVGIDSAGAPVGPALLWADRRAQGEAMTLQQGLAAARIDPLDTPGDAYFGTGKLLWLARNRPDQLDKCRHVLSTNGFIVERLTGAACLDLSTATMLQGFHREGPDPLLAQLGVPVDLLPPVVASIDVAGVVTAAAAEMTGLPAGIPVAAGAIDAVGTALEAGALLPGDPFVEMTGFSTVGMVPTAAGLPAQGLIRSAHCFAGVDLLLTAQVTSGAVIDWLVALTGGDRAVLDPVRLRAVTRPGRVRMLTALAGERTPGWNPWIRGLIGGIGLDTTAADLLVAAMEGVAIALELDRRLLAEHGLPVHLVRSTGGGSANPVWLQIKADVLGLPVERPRASSGAAHGAALLAGLAVGDIDGPDEVRALTDGPTQHYRPDPVVHAGYRQRIAEIVTLREAAISLVI